MHLTIVAATPFEIEPTRQFLIENFQSKDQLNFIKGEQTVQVLITGVGSTATAFSLGQYLSKIKTNLLINAGIAGAFSEKHKIGDVLLVERDRFGDLGVEEANGQFVDVYELEMPAPNTPPYKDGWLINLGALEQKFLPTATSITVQKVHGSADSITKIRNKYPVDLESMEGAAVHYAALMTGTPFFQIRSVSNLVEPRNKDNWDIGKAIAELNKVVIGMINLG
jgi:futalosine nucleosidase